MKKEELKKKFYVKPDIKVIHTNVEGYILAGSPPVKPGTSVEDPTEDNDNTDISDAKRFNVWDDKEE
ncbi:MAG TPA: hypothetical protein VIQ97_01670 [Prevotella sp.]